MTEQPSIEVRLVKLEERLRAVEDRAGFVDRDVCDLRHGVVDAKLGEIKEVQAVAKGKGIAYGLGLSLLLAVITAIVAVLLKVLK